MERNQQFEDVLNYDFFQDAKRCDMTALEYAKENISANERWFFIDGTDAEIRELNNQFLQYIKETYDE